MHNINGDSCSAGLGDVAAIVIQGVNLCMVIKAKGSRNITTHPHLFTCFCPCGAQPAPPSPPPAAAGKCNAGLSEICCAQCRDQCCNAKCASRFAIGQGHCDKIGTQLLCECTYDC